MYLSVHPFFIGLSPDPSPVGRGTEIVLQNTNKSNFKTPLPTGEGLGERLLIMLRLYALPAPQ